MYAVCDILSTGHCRRRSEGPATMESCGVGLRANTHLPKSGRSIKNGCVGLLGERTRGSLNHNVWVDQVAKSLKIDHGSFKRKIKPGAAFAIITSNNSADTLVRHLILTAFFFSFCILS